MIRLVYNIHYNGVHIEDALFLIIHHSVHFQVHGKVEDVLPYMEPAGVGTVCQYKNYVMTILKK